MAGGGGVAGGAWRGAWGRGERKQNSSVMHLCIHFFFFFSIFGTYQIVLLSWQQSLAQVFGPDFSELGWNLFLGWAIAN